MNLYMQCNTERTRKAVARGKAVTFMTRKPSKEIQRNFRVWWRINAPSFEEAMRLVDEYALRGKMPVH